MIYHTVTWPKHPDMSKRPAQTQVALELAAYAAKKFPAGNFQILSNINTPTGYWLDTFESLADWEAAEQELFQDAGWLAIWADATEKGLISSDMTHSFFRVES